MDQFQNERMIAAYQMIGAMELALRAHHRLPEGAPGVRRAARWPTSRIQYELADIAAELDLQRHHNWAAVAAYRTVRTSPATRPSAKLRSARLARRMADTAVQYHGGMGYVEENWPPGSSATRGCGPSAAGRTRSCCAPWPA